MGVRTPYQASFLHGTYYEGLSYYREYVYYTRKKRLCKVTQLAASSRKRSRITMLQDLSRLYGRSRKSERAAGLVGILVGIARDLKNLRNASLEPREAVALHLPGDVEPLSGTLTIRAYGVYRGSNGNCQLGVS